MKFVWAVEDAVWRLVASPKLRQTLGQAAQQTMASYTWVRSAVKFEKLLRYVLELEAKASE
jgi:hypothetical protein